jgi:acyl-CoA thioesterase-1
VIRSYLSKRLLLAVAVSALGSSPTPALAQPVSIVALGDSNTAGFLVGRRNAFPAIMEEKLRAAGFDVDVTNRGINGDTTGGMLARLDKAVPRGTRIAIVQGGYNDGRRGVSAQQRDANVDAILGRLATRKVRAVLCGLAGAQWARIARRHGAMLVPGSTCYDAESRGFDRLHMNRAGHRTVAGRLTQVVQRMLR